MPPEAGQPRCLPVRRRRKGASRSSRDSPVDDDNDNDGKQGRIFFLIINKITFFSINHPFHLICLGSYGNFFLPSIDFSSL
jgi:hypothetical protein